jgi:cobalt-precorrin 5A hydrolase/precorrin-3B C17-methyltransferase
MPDAAMPGQEGRGTLVLGLGCERGTPAAELLDLAGTVLSLSGRAASEISAVASLDTRAGEPAMEAVARRFGVPFTTFPAARLEAETPRLANPSAVVFAHTGCHGVAEAAALAAAGTGGVLVCAKTKSPRATAAIAESFQAPGGVRSQADCASSPIDSSRGSD